MVALAWDALVEHPDAAKMVLPRRREPGIPEYSIAPTSGQPFPRRGAPKYRMVLVKHTFRRSLGAVRLHRDVRIQVIQRAISLLAPLEAALVHSFDLFISSTWALVLLSAWNRNK